MTISPSPAFDRRADLALLRDAAIQAGAILRGSFGGNYKVWSKGAAGPVTEVDLEVDALLKQLLCSARPDYGWLSEESPDTTDRLGKDRVFIVDPLDGTRAFINGKDDFCTALAIAENGAPVAGVVFNPIRDECFEGALGLGARLNGSIIAPSTRSAIEGMRMAGASNAFAPARWVPPWPVMHIEQRSALAYRASLVAAGAFDGMISLGYKREWDLAAPTVIALEAGASVTDPWGGELRFNQPDTRVPGVVISGPSLHPLLLERLTQVPHPSKLEQST